MRPSDVIITPAKWMIGPPAPWFFPYLARLLMLLAMIIMGHWVRVYLHGVALSPIIVEGGGNDTGLLFNWHPILMTLAFAVFMTEAVITYQAPIVPGISRPIRKKIHWALHCVSAVCILLGLIAVFQSHNLKRPTPIANLYSPHSYLGLFAVALGSTQFLLGLGSYLWPTIPVPHRVALAPVHRFLGLSTWGFGLAAIMVGVQEKVTFLQVYGKLSDEALYGPLVTLPASLLIVLPLLVIVVLYCFVPAATPAGKGMQQGLLERTSRDDGLGAYTEARSTIV